MTDSSASRSTFDLSYDMDMSDDTQVTTTQVSTPTKKQGESGGLSSVSAVEENEPDVLDDLFAGLGSSDDNNDDINQTTSDLVHHDNGSDMSGDNDGRDDQGQGKHHESSQPLSAGKIEKSSGFLTGYMQTIQEKIAPLTNPVRDFLGQSETVQNVRSYAKQKMTQSYHIIDSKKRQDIAAMPVWIWIIFLINPVGLLVMIGGYFQKRRLIAEKDIDDSEKEVIDV